MNSMNKSIAIPAGYVHLLKAGKKGDIEITHSDADIKTQASAALKRVDGYYWRALRALDSRRATPLLSRVLASGRIDGIYLEFEDYAKHWLWANGERMFPVEVLAFLADQWGYKPEQHPMIEFGCTFYEDSSAISQGFVLRGGRYQRPATRRPARA